MRSVAAPWVKTSTNWPMAVSNNFPPATQPAPMFTTSPAFRRTVSVLEWAERFRTSSWFSVSVLLPVPVRSMISISWMRLSRMAVRSRCRPLPREAERVGPESAVEPARAGEIDVGQRQDVVAFAADQDVGAAIGDQRVVPAAADEHVAGRSPLVGGEGLAAGAAELRLGSTGEVPAEHEVRLAGIAAVGTAGIGAVRSDQQVVEPVPVDVPGARHRAAGVVVRVDPLQAEPGRAIEVGEVDPAVAEAVGGVEGGQVRRAAEHDVRLAGNVADRAAGIGVRAPRSAGRRTRPR